MNASYEAILDRRSCRKYKAEPLSDALLEQVLQAGFYAPTAMNRQPWHFVVIKNRATLDKIMEFHPYTKFLNQAPCAVVVCGDLEISPAFYIDDCAAATQNMLLAAHALGLGSCWCGVDHTDRVADFAALLNLPEHIRAYSLVVLGHPDEAKPRPERVLPQRIHTEQW